jgi:hypothetical protein
MRFKAKLATDQVQLLKSVIGPISKLLDQQQTAKAVLMLDPDQVQLSTRGGGDDIVSCAEFDTSAIFLERRIESAAENNSIVMQVDLHAMKTALDSVATSRGNNKRATSVLKQPIVTLKLAKRNGLPCLCLDLSGNVDVHHSIAVRIMRIEEWYSFWGPPQINSATVNLDLSGGPPLRGVIDKLRSMGSYVFLEGSMTGKLTVRLDQDGASVACFYHQLVPLDDEHDDTTTTTTAPQQCTLKVNAQKLFNCLQWQQQSSGMYQDPMRQPKFCISMVPQEMLVVHVEFPPAGFMTYYVPVLFIPEEDEEQGFL